MTRESAGVLRDSITAAIEKRGEIALDFAGVEIVTPSFIDEIIGFIDDARAIQPPHKLRVLFLNAPSPLSAKYTAIGRRHGAKLAQPESGTWEITGLQASES